jgi:hypothetical protein
MEQIAQGGDNLIDHNFKVFRKISVTYNKIFEI